MKQISVTVIDPVGLHARPATIAVNAAAKFKSEVKVAYKGRSVNMKSIMGVMSLGIPTQSEITISCEGDDEDIAAQTIEEVLRAQKVIAAAEPTKADVDVVKDAQ
jgi:phosphocarrier protein